MDKAEKLCAELYVELGFIFSQYLYNTVFLKVFYPAQIGRAIWLNSSGRGQ